MTFPKVRAASLTQNCTKAIEQNDALAVHDIRPRITLGFLEEQDYLRKAIKYKGFNTAFVLIRHLQNQCISDKMMWEVAMEDHATLLEIVVKRGGNVKAKVFCPLLAALVNAKLNAVRVLMSYSNIASSLYESKYVFALEKGFMAASLRGG